MTKKKFNTKEDWEKFRNKILELIMIYNQVKKFSQSIFTDFRINGRDFETHIDGYQVVKDISNCLLTNIK